MDKLDDAAAAVLTAANVSDLTTLSRDDLRDLFPGPENFLKRKTIWLAIHSKDSVREPTRPVAGSPSSVRRPQQNPTPEKTVKLHSPEYVLYTDTELEQVRKEYSELERAGKEKDCKMPKDLRCRLIRNTMTSMISILRATGDGESHKYPSKQEINAMAKTIVQYYPMLKDREKNNRNTWVTVCRQLSKRMHNVRSPVGEKRPVKRRCLESSPDEQEFDSSDSISDATSEDSAQDSNSEGRNNSHADGDSPAPLKKPNRSLQALWKKTNPKESVSQLLDLEFDTRRAFIDSDAIKEGDRHEKVLNAYPCFREIDYAVDELRRILSQDNMSYIDEVKGRLADFFQKVRFYGVWRKILKSPIRMDKAQQAIELIRALPALFPSSCAPPKRLRDASEALIHVLEEKEDVAAFLKKRPLTCPLLIVGSSNVSLALGDRTVAAFQKEMLHEGLLYIIAYYYALHLSYPKCIATVLSMIQTEVLLDSMHEQDQTSAFKKTMRDWRAFVGN